MKGALVLPQRFIIHYSLFIMQKIAQNGGMNQQMMEMQQQLQQLAGMVDTLQGSNLAGQVTPPPQQEPPRQAAGGSETKVTGGESSVTRNARQRVAQAGTPT